MLVKLLIWRLKHISDKNFLLILSGIIGLIAGLGAVILKTTVHYIHQFLQSGLDINNVNFLYLFYPLIGILLTATIAKYFLKEKLGHGITSVLYRISKRSSIIEPVKMYSRMITSAITVGLGGSVGLEAPIVVTGSAIGSNIAQLVHLDYKKRTILIGCGSAAAISAIFNSPIAGVIFAIEVLLTDVTIAQFIPLLIASVSGSLISTILLGDEPLFTFKLTDPFQAGDVPFFILLGLFCGIISVYFSRVIFIVEKEIDKVNNYFVRAFVGGLSLAIIILTFPPIYGEGYETIKLLLAGQEQDIFSRSFFYGWSNNVVVLMLFLFSIILIKPIATALTLGAGGSGGIFAPSLFIGGVAGYFAATLLNFAIPGVDISTSNFTLVGMCGLMSGVLHAPLTAIFLIAEITSGYTLFVPLMLVSVISFSTISYFEKHSIYTKRLIEKGDLIQYDKDRQVLSLINLNKIIEKDLLSINPDSTLGDLVKLVRKSKRNIFPVINGDGGLDGIITLDDIREIMFDINKQEQILVKAIMHQPPDSVSTIEEMRSVMSKFEITQAWNLPVIDDGKYIGFVSKSRIFNAYRQKLIRQNKE
ncbi:MAG: chloride channel protein [Bacteroidetes bacterium]|nr:chloride channel protein [Bacteroidota bacterium]MDA1122049.1 chloride channel protein [Bacteroidota bacterium]